MQRIQDILYATRIFNHGITEPCTGIYSMSTKWYFTLCLNLGLIPKLKQHQISENKDEKILSLYLRVQGQCRTRMWKKHIYSYLSNVCKIKGNCLCRPSNKESWWFKGKRKAITSVWARWEENRFHVRGCIYHGLE